MIGDGGETPSRSELLSMVKKHSNVIGKTILDEQDASDVEMDSGFWHDSFDLYFIRGKETRGQHDDDMIFFVRKKGSQAHRDNVDDLPPYFVRRWASKLDKLVGDISTDVDWRRSFYLNLIAHTSYSVTVAICSHQVLRNRPPGQNPFLPSIYKKLNWFYEVCLSRLNASGIHYSYKSVDKPDIMMPQGDCILCRGFVSRPLRTAITALVVKTVYASPSRINFHLESRKEDETTPAYPDICFAVDDFDSTFDAVVLSSTDHCYCVLLNAHDGAAFPPTEETCSNKSLPKDDTNSGKSIRSKVTLFSGFVSYQMVQEAYSAGKSQFGSFLSLGQPPGKTDRVYMKGPGGRGEVEVAVSGVIDQSHHDVAADSASRKGSKIGLMFRQAAMAAKHAYEATSASTSYENEMVPLKCGLMSVSLPWEHIAHDLLFKATPPVNL